MTGTETTPEPPKRGRGRPRRGARCETKLGSSVLAEVESLVGAIGADRSEVIAVLVRRSLAHTHRGDHPMTDRVAIAALAAADPHAQEARLVDGIISIGGVSVDISGMEPMASEMLAGAGWRILPRYFAGVKCADPWGWMDSSEEAAGYWCAIDRSA